MPARIDSSRRIIGSCSSNLRLISFGTTLVCAALISSVITCSSMPNYRNSREARFMRSTSCKMNCESLQIFSCFWTRNYRATPRGTTICFWKPCNKIDLPQATTPATGHNLQRHLSIRGGQRRARISRSRCGAKRPHAKSHGRVRPHPSLSPPRTDINTTGLDCPAPKPSPLDGDSPMYRPGQLVEPITDTVLMLHEFEALPQVARR